jgi:hypothetical protein
MGEGKRAAVAVTATLALTGVLASVALGDSCVEAVRWNDVLYVGVTTADARLERGGRLGEGEIPDCTASGRCAPPEERTAVFAVTGVAPEIAIASPAWGNESGIFLAPGTFPALPDHPLHEALYGSAEKPNYRQQCGDPFTLRGEVTQTSLGLRIRAADPVPEQLEEDEDGQVWLELDARSRAEGFDRNGVAMISVGEEVVATARLCEVQGEPTGPLVDVLRPG